MQDHLLVQIGKCRTKLPNITPHDLHRQSLSLTLLLSYRIVQAVISRQLNYQVNGVLVTEAAIEGEEVGMVEE